MLPLDLAGLRRGLARFLRWVLCPLGLGNMSEDRWKHITDLKLILGCYFNANDP
jgi:hypothetical protein